MLQFIPYLEINGPHPISARLFKENGAELYFIFLPCFYGEPDSHEKFIYYQDLCRSFTSMLQNARKHLKEHFPWNSQKEVRISGLYVSRENSYVFWTKLHGNIYCFQVT